MANDEEPQFTMPVHFKYAMAFSLFNGNNTLSLGSLR